MKRLEAQLVSVTAGHSRHSFSVWKGSQRAD